MKTVSRTTVPNPAALLGLVGEHLGTSAPMVISQEQVNQFADVTGDHQWIHVDVERAKDGPFGGPIVHGFLTLAMVPKMLAEVLVVEEFSMGVNYGIDRVRFIRPVPPDVPIQGSATLVHAELIPGADGDSPSGIQAKASVAVEFADESQPCCVAEILFRYYG